MITQALLTLGLSNTGFPLFSQCSAIVVNRSVYVSWPNLKNTHSWTCQIKLWTWSSPFAFCFILQSGRYEQIIWALYALRLRLYSTRVWTRSEESDNDIQWHDTDGQTSSKPREEIYDHNPIKISLRRRYAESDATKLLFSVGRVAGCSADETRRLSEMTILRLCSAPVGLLFDTELVVKVML